MIKRAGRAICLVAGLFTIATCISYSICPVISAETNVKKEFFGVEYDPSITHMKAIESSEKYEGIPAPLPRHQLGNYIQPWSGYCPACTAPNKTTVDSLTCQTFNIKGGDLYEGIQVEGNKWAKLACEEAKHSVEVGDGPFGAVLVQIDDETGNVIRYWRTHAHVVAWSDPTAHAELTAVRAACQQLGSIKLSNIERDDPQLKLPQTGKTSHCDLYASTEPCPMCYTAMRRAGINTIVFCATKFDAGVQGVGLPIDNNFLELQQSYENRSKFGVHMYQSTVDNSLDAFNLYKRSNVAKY